MDMSSGNNDKKTEVTTSTSSATQPPQLQTIPQLQDQYKAVQKPLAQPITPINLSSGKSGESSNLQNILQPDILPVTAGMEAAKDAVPHVTSAPASAPSNFSIINTSTTPSIPQGSIIQIAPGGTCSSILTRGPSANLPFAHLPRGAMAAASALTGPKSLALPMVRHPGSTTQNPATPKTSLIRSTAPPVSKTPASGVTIAITQPTDTVRTNVTVQSSSNNPQGSIQITLQAPRPSVEGAGKTLQRTTDVQKPLIQALRTTSSDTAAKTIITTPARTETSVKSMIHATIRSSLDAKQANRTANDPSLISTSIRSSLDGKGGRMSSESPLITTKTIHVPQTPSFAGTKMLVSQSSSSPHSVATNLSKSNKGPLTIPTSSLSAALSSVTTTTSAIPIAKVPPVRQQQPLSVAPHTVGSTNPTHPQDRTRLEMSYQGSAPPAHSSANVFMPHRTQSTTAISSASTPLAHNERSSLPTNLYPSHPPYFVPELFMYQQQMLAQQANAQANVHTISNISTASPVRQGLLQNQTPNLAASLQAAAHQYPGTSAASVRFNPGNPVVVAMDTLRQQQAMSGTIPYSTSSASTPDSVARPSTPTDNLASLSSAAAATASIPLPALSAMGLVGQGQTYPSTPATPQHNQSTPVSTPNASPRPSILRKRASEGPVKKPVCGLNTMDRHSPRPDSRTDSAPQSNTSSPKTPATPAGESQSSTDTALSSEATTPTQNSMGDIKIKQEPIDSLENGLSVAINNSIASLSGSLPNSTDASPRKKPRKQLLNANEELKDNVSSDDDKLAVDLVKEEAINEDHTEEYIDDEGVRWTLEKNRPNLSLLNFYNISWKPRNNHFNRHTDIKPKDERRPTVNELANQRGAVQKASGWKLYHMAAQMEDLNELEKTLLTKLSSIQTTLSPHFKPTVVAMEDDLSIMHELTQANIQRCKLIMDQLEESRTNMLKVLDHKQKISEIINKHVSKRPIKKKERS